MNQAIKPEVADNTTSTVNAAEPIIIAIDHGYGNIKTSNFCFPANVTPINDGLSFTDDILVYDGASYAIGLGHKEFRADKIMDQDYYLLTLAAIGKELDRRGMTKATIVIAAGLPLTWGIEQKKSFQEYLTQKKHVDFSYKSIVYHVEVQEAMIFNQGIAAVANLINKSFKGTNMLVDIGNGEVANPEGLQVRFADRTGRIENSSGAPV